MANVVRRRITATELHSDGRSSARITLAATSIAARANARSVLGSPAGEKAEATPALPGTGCNSPSDASNGGRMREKSGFAAVMMKSTYRPPMMTSEVCTVM